MELRRWVRRHRVSIKRGRERRQLHNAEVEAGEKPRQSHFCTQTPIQQFRSRATSSGSDHRLRPKIGKVWAKIATAMMVRSPTTRWRYVRGHMSAVTVTLMQHHWRPFGTHPGKTRKATDGTSRLEVWELTTGVSGKPSEPRLRGSCGRRRRGMSWEQAWRDGAHLRTLFKHDHYLERKGLCAARGMLLAAATASCWTQERRYRAGLVESPLCPRCEEEDEDMHHRVWQCRANTGEIFDKTQHLVQKATQSQRHFGMFLAQGAGATILDFARHEVGFLASIWEWRIDLSLYIRLWGRLGNAQRSANQAPKMVCSHCSGYVKLSWANPGKLEIAQ